MGKSVSRLFLLGSQMPAKRLPMLFARNAAPEEVLEEAKAFFDLKISHRPRHARAL